MNIFFLLKEAHISSKSSLSHKLRKNIELKLLTNKLKSINQIQAQQEFFISQNTQTRAHTHTQHKDAHTHTTQTRAYTHTYTHKTHTHTQREIHMHILDGKKAIFLN